MSVSAETTCARFTKRFLLDETLAGAPGATRRSALPEAFPLPQAAAPFVHEVRMHEWDDFTPHPTVTSGLPPAAEVELAEADGVLTVLLVRGASGWPPARPPAWRPAAIELRPEQTLRWQVNYRFTTEDGWYYRLDTLNVCYGTAPAGVFLDPPAHRIDDRARLRSSPLVMITDQQIMISRPGNAPGPHPPEAVILDTAAGRASQRR